ncbi:MAG: hypothetical protein Q8R47_06525 [Nanoarchaeota archaeon]|nr:hypothetical protein [Nanoarchaeota archaeon]
MAIELLSNDPAYVNDPAYRSKLLEEQGFEEEEAELIAGEYQKTGFPKALRNCRLLWEVYDLSLEEPYFWLLDYFKDAFPIIEKIEDSFAAAENSAFFGVTQQRLGAQQDRVSQFLATMGKMVKELFQMVRELRIIDERLGYYDAIEKELRKPIAERSKTAEITMKGLFVDLVQGGGKSAASVYGMARELEFITLPDLFFDAPPFKDDKELVQHLRSLEANFNKNVLRVLQRHLGQYMEWKKRTHHEHRNRKIFQLKYLQQHFDIIKMYLTWVKPYLRHARALTMKEKSLTSAELVSAFEGSLLDVEILARKPAGKGKAHSCVLVTFNYRTRAELKVQQEGYQRGPVHIGRMVVTFRAYAWSDEQLKNYKALKQKELFELLGDVSTSVQQAMESLGDELFRYLEEAKGNTAVEKKEEKKEEPKKSFAEKFFGDFYTPTSAKAPKGPSAKHLKMEQDQVKEDVEKAVGLAVFHTFNAYHLFKKAHRMAAW